jgi:hypothetical protein
MGYSNELNNNLMVVLNKLITNQNLCKLLYYTSTDPLSEANISDTRTLIKKNIIPKPFIQGVIETPCSFLTVYFDNFTFANRSYSDGRIIFEAIVHESLWDIKGGIRPYSILDEIELLFDNQKVIGIGKTQIDSIRQLWVNDSYKGYRLVFKFSDLK